MRLPNGFGSISKLSGKRRNPYIVRVTEGFDDNGKQIFKTLGYVKSRKAGLEMLMEYHKDPSAVGDETTFADMYHRLMERKEDELTDSTKMAYRSAFRAAKSIHDVKMREIRLHHFEKVLADFKTASYSTRAKYKTLYVMVCDLAMQHDMIEKNYASYIELGKPDNKKEKLTYTDEEIERLWQHSGDDFIDATLILLYTGMRIGELLDMKMENIHLDEKYMIGGSKTEAGKNRTIALADKIIPLVRRLYGDGTKKQLILSPTGKAVSVSGFRHHWEKRMEMLKIDRGIHETRHTCISNLYKAGVEPAIVRRLVGHSGHGVTEKVYLHVGLDQLLEAVNKLK